MSDAAALLDTRPWEPQRARRRVARHRRYSPPRRRLVVVGALFVSALWVGSQVVFAQTDADVRDRWRTWPVTAIFPSNLPGTTRSGAPTAYVRLGIAPEASCRVALQPAAAAAYEDLGCVSVLRATYTDATATYLVTTAIVVLSDDHLVPALFAAKSRTTSARPATVRPAAFPGTPAEEFGDAQYITGTLVRSDRRYAVLTAAGYADGRAYQSAARVDPRLADLAGVFAQTFHRRMTGCGPC